MHFAYQTLTFEFSAHSNVLHKAAYNKLCESENSTLVD